MKQERFISFAVALGLFIAAGRCTAGITVPADYHWSDYVEGVNNGKAIAFASSGLLYVAHDEGSQIYRVGVGGTMVEHWGPSHNDPDCLDVDASDHVYIGTESQGLYRVAPDGTSTLVTTSHMGNNFGLCIDRGGLFGQAGRVFVANARASADIVAVTPAGVATPFVSGSVLYTPSAIVFDDSQYLYAVDVDSKKLYRIDNAGTVSELAAFAGPYSLAFHQSGGKLYVGDISEKRIYAVELNGTKTVFAEGIEPWGLTFGPDGHLYVVDRGTTPDRVVCIRFQPQVRASLAVDGTLSWNAGPGWMCQVETSRTLADEEWSPVGDPIEALDVSAQTTVSLGTFEAEFFRVRVWGFPPF